MSYMINTHEELELVGTSQKVEKIKGAVQEYLINLLSRNSIESLSIDEIQLIVDEDKEIISSLNYDFGDKGSKERSKKNLSYFNDIIEAISTAEHVFLMTRYSCMKYAGGEYGYMYFSQYLDESLLEDVKYKVLEFYDVDSDVIAYKFGKYGNEIFDGDVIMTENKDTIDQIEDWYCNNFFIGISMLADAYDDGIKSLIHDLEGAVREDFRLYQINGRKAYELSAGLTGGFDFHEVIDLLSRITDCVSGKNGTTRLVANFVPDVEDDFSKVELCILEGKLVVKTCLF